MVNRKQLLRYRRGEDKVLSIQDYYTTHLSHLASKFSRYSFDRSNTVVCPFHNDNDPSFGVIKGKDGLDRYHCFGCGVVGDFVDFYINIQRVFNSRNLTEGSAIQEICKLYAIPLDDLEVDYTQEVLSREESMQAMKSSYYSSDFERDVRMGILTGKPVAYYNAKLLEYISSQL